MILILVEKNLDGAAVEVSLEALTFARDLVRRGRWRAGRRGRRRCGQSVDRRAAQAAGGVRRPHASTRSAATASRRTPGPAGPPAILSRARAAQSVVVMAAGTARGNELMAHVAARAGVAMAANVLSFHGLVAVRGHPPGGRRRGARGDACSTSGRRSSPWPATRSRPSPADVPGRGRRRRASRPRSPPPTWSRGWSRPSSPSPTCPAALKSARVVVGAGRGAGGPDGFADLLELTDAARRRARRLAGRHLRSAGGRTTSRSARPAAGSRPTSTSRAASAAPSSTGPAARRPRRSWRSTPTPRRRW